MDTNNLIFLDGYCNENLMLKDENVKFSNKFWTENPPTLLAGQTGNVMKHRSLKT